MDEWEFDPACQAVWRAFGDGNFLDQVGGPLDVRAVVAAVRPEVKDGFLLEEVPWDRFPDGDRVGEDMERLRSGAPAAARGAFHALLGLCANDMRAAVAPTVPFLIRIAANPGSSHRVEALGVVAEVARMRHQGVCTRQDMLRFRDDDEWSVEVTGYPQNWSVQAAREAVATDTGLLLPLLHDLDAAVRIAAAYVLAAALDRAQDIRTALHTRLDTEDAPAVRAALVLAIAQLGRAHRHEPTLEWAREGWADPARPAEVRVSAALGWMCLTDLPVPDELRAVLDDLATDDTARLMAPLPWMQAAEYRDGLRCCLHAMLHPNVPDPAGYSDDPWA